MLIQFITGNIVVELTLIDGDDADRQTHTDVCMHATTLKFVQGSHAVAILSAIPG